VQKVFANNVGTRIVPVTPHAEAGLYTSASLDDHTHELIVTAVNYSASPRQAELQLNGINPSTTAEITTLSSDDLAAENSFDQPTKISPVSSTLQVASGKISVQLEPYSLTVYRIPAQ
jgi:alpha-N-arabinofuranosidase